MYPAKPGLIIAFHGCDQSVTNKIVNGNANLNFSRNKYDWLGNGIYFWENNQQRALDFARELKNNPREGRQVIKKPSVLGAVIDMGFCLDLLDTEYINLVKESYQTLVASCITLELPVPVNKGLRGSKDLLLRNLDCAVIENLHIQRDSNNLKAFDSVRGAFIEGEPLYSNAGFHEKNHIQICLRNPNCIKGFFLPRSADDKYSVP
jgi:hypothetical protein